MRVVVTDFQSLGKVDVTVEGFTVLVGPSNRGKSALVRAIEAVLFNKPGDQFVRTGKKKAVVEVTDLPAADGTMLPKVTWTKGGGKTIYTVGGETFSKVGQGTPPPLTVAGYRDVWVGDKDRNRGEYIRPQVSKQGPGTYFLIDRSGAFVSDVLGAISRHAVLLTAQGRASGDHRGAKQRLGLRQTDLTAAQAQFEALDAVPALAARVEAFRTAYAALHAARERIAHGRALTARRALLAPLLAYPKPKPDVARSPQEAADLAAWHERLSRGRHAAVRRSPLAAVAAAALPTVSQVPDHGPRLAKARGLVAHRRALAALAGTPLPATRDWAVLVHNAEQWVGQRVLLGIQCTRRRQALHMLHRCETAVRESDTELAVAKAALTDVLASNPLCPTCEQPLGMSPLRNL